VVVDSAEYATQLTISHFTAPAMLTDNFTAPRQASTLRTASSSARAHTRSYSVSTRVSSCTSQELDTMCAIRNCRRIQNMNDNYEQLAADFAGNMALTTNTQILKLCISSIHPPIRRSRVKPTSGAVSTQYWISAEHYSTCLKASVHERQCEVIQGLFRSQAIHSLDQNFTSVVMKAYLGCHGEIHVPNVLRTVGAV
jgi:hypothetical protein